MGMPLLRRSLGKRAKVSVPPGDRSELVKGILI